MVRLSTQSDMKLSYCSHMVCVGGKSHIFENLFLGYWCCFDNTHFYKQLYLDILCTLIFYMKPRVRRSGSAFLRIPECQSQKFLKLIKIPVLSFFKFLQFEPPIFLKFCFKNFKKLNTGILINLKNFKTQIREFLRMLSLTPLP